MKIEIVVTFQFELIHRWPACDVPGMEFLKNPHRHLFHGTAWKVVQHEDREIEIIDFKHKIEAFMRAAWSTDHLSCESIARRIVEVFGLSRCRILEDGENGAEVTA